MELVVVVVDDDAHNTHQHIQLRSFLVVNVRPNKRWERAPETEIVHPRPEVLHLNAATALRDHKVRSGLERHLLYVLRGFVVVWFNFSWGVVDGFLSRQKGRLFC